MMGRRRAMWAMWVVVVVIIGGGGALTVARAQEEQDFENGGGRALNMLVPRKVGFEQFANVTCPHGHNATCNFSGFAVHVFNTCIQNLSSRRKLHINYLAFGNGSDDPSYDAMVQHLVNKEADGIVGDLTITAERARVIDFTHPYIQSTLVMIVPYLDNPTSKELWNFMKPFSLGLWICVLVLYISTTLVIFALEQKNPHFHEPGLDWRHRLANVFWYTSMTLFIAQNSDVSTKLGRLLIFFWLMVVLIFTATYTASLASMLSSRRHVPKYGSFQEIQKNLNITIGCNDGSFTRRYIEGNLNIKPERLILLETAQDYEKNLQTNKVGVILDELPYAQVFLNTRCQYSKVHQQLAYFGGFGFAFQKNSSLTLDISLEILKLEQNGDLEDLRKQFLGTNKCSDTDTSDTNVIPLSNFGGLFIIVASLYTTCLLLRVITWVLDRRRKAKPQIAPMPAVSPPSLVGNLTHKTPSLVAL